MKDNYGRKIDYLRISLTDRCNLRCIYYIFFLTYFVQLRIAKVKGLPR